MTYSQLTSIPLFWGISGDDLAIIMDRVELLDIKLLPGEVFVGSGDVCQGMAIVRDGIMSRKRVYHAGTFVNSRKQKTDLSYQVTETLSPGFILEPEILFGLEQRHRNTWTAVTTCHLTLIGKDDIRQTLMYVPVWRINFLNLLCTQLQRSQEDGLPMVTPDDTGRVRQFISRHCSINGETMQTDITLEQLGHFLGMERRMVSSVIAELEGLGQLVKERKRLFVPHVGRLVAKSG